MPDDQRTRPDDQFAQAEKAVNQAARAFESALLYLIEAVRASVPDAAPGDRPAPAPAPESPQPPEGDAIDIGVVYGPEVTDNLRPGVWPGYPDVVPLSRVYVGIRKDFQDADLGDPSLPVAPVADDGALDHSLGLPWGVYSNVARMTDLREAGVRRPLISPESFHSNPHWTWKYLRPDDWTGGRADREEASVRVAQWYVRHVRNMNLVWGVGQWKSHLASEPWADPEAEGVEADYFQWYMRALLDGFLLLDPDERPEIYYPALPIGQGSAKLQSDGFPTNGFYAGTLTDYVLPEWREHIDVLTFHAYALSSRQRPDGSWELYFDEAKIDYAVSIGLEAVRFRDAVLPHAAVACTEHGAPFDALWAGRFYAECRLRWSAAGIREAYVYSLRRIKGGEHFEVAYLIAGDGRAHRYYGAVDQTKAS